jgi:general bacterial porin, GBP family
MKKKLIGAAALAVFGAAAHAQSSVTLFGLLDTGIVYTNNQSGSSAWQQSSSLLSNTLFGLKGSEDLGGGLHAIFRLESGFNVNNGQPYYRNTMFGRQAYVGLQSDNDGTLTLGRQYDSVVDFLGPLALANNGDGNNLAAHPFDNDNVDDSFYINNSVKYASATYGGVQFGALYGFSNQAGGFANNRAYSVGASYSNGPINLAAAYLQVNNAGGGPLGSNLNGAVSSNDNPYFISERQRVVGVGGNYTFGPATVGLLWTHTMFDKVAAIAGTSLGLPGAAMHLDNYEVNARYALTPALSVAGAYTFTDGRFSGADGKTDPKWHQVTLMTDYAFSKRTDVYLEGVYQHAFGAPDGSVLSHAMINGLSPSSTGNQIAATVGIRHRF